MQTEQLSFVSYDGKSPVSAVLWQNDFSEQPRAIVQLVHGMTEHIGRYTAFAQHLCNQGYAVCGHDHIGHGKSVSSEADWGTLPSQGGERVLVEDVHTVRTRVSERYDEHIPYIIFGHSMGSFVTRLYLTYHAQGLAGAIICGTGQQPALLSSIGRSLAKHIAKKHGDNYYAPLLQSLADGAYSKAIKPARTPFDWLCTDDAVVDAYIAAPNCGFSFKAGGYATLIGLTNEIVQPENIARIPKNLPLFFVAGSEDPVGDCGKGVQKAYQSYVDAGIHDVRIKLYEGMRHEILNETNKELVYADLDAWIEEQICKNAM